MTLFARRRESEDERKKLTVRVPPDLYRQAKIKAAETGQSFQEVLETMLREWVRNNPPANR